jgi:hypothetical protein
VHIVRRYSVERDLVMVDLDSVRSWPLSDSAISTLTVRRVTARRWHLSR